MQRKRILFIHAGGGKTGSSALQSAFAEAASKLATAGIAYANVTPASSHYAITSGNGTALYDLIGSPRWEAEGANLLESHLGSHAVGICSCEFLGNMSAGNWRKLLETAASLAIEVRVVFFARPAGSYLAASYNQDVKRGGVSVELEEYLSDATWHHLDALMTLDAAIPASSLCVLNYDACRSNLAHAFAASFPELAPAEKVLRGATARKVNRSLDSVEVAVVRRINRQLGAKAGESLSDRLIYSDPEKNGGLGLDKAQADIIAAKYADGTSWINARFFAGTADPLPLSSGAEKTDTAFVQVGGNATAVALDWALEQCGTQAWNGSGAVRESLLNIDWQNAGFADIPPDFDPIAYLIQNEDIVRAAIPPFIHYHSSGKLENRAYRWPQAVDAQYDADIASAAAPLSNQGGERSATDPMQRLRHQYQIEGLLHAFAAREREYLDQIRKLIERGGFSRAEIRQELSSLREATVATLVNKGEKDNAVFRGELHDLGASLLQAQASAASAASAASERVVETIAQLLTAGNAANAEFSSEIRALRAEQSRLNEVLVEKDLELTRYRETVSQYREAGLLGFMWWAIRRSLRP